MEIAFAATDPDGDILSFFAQERGGRDVFPGSVMRDHHDGSATFTWETQPEDAGIHNLRVAVFDEGGGEELTDIAIAICNRMLEDGDVDGVLAATFGHAPDVPPVCRGADLNGDGVVNAADLLLTG